MAINAFYFSNIINYMCNIINEVTSLPTGTALSSISLLNVTFPPFSPPLRRINRQWDPQLSSPIPQNQLKQTTTIVSNSFIFTFATVHWNRQTEA